MDTATAEVVRDPQRRNAFILLLDGVESSHVDLDEPGYLAFEYMQWFGGVLDCVGSGRRDDPDPALNHALKPVLDPALNHALDHDLDVVHLGGGAATLARYVASRWPRSRQLVFEIDAALVDVVRARLPLPKTRRLRIRVCDARAGLLGLPTGSADLVVRDAFRDAAVPAHLTTLEFCLLVKEILRPGGVYLLNTADGVPFRNLGAEVATVAAVFHHFAVVSEPAVFRGRRHGNVVMAASDHPLPVDAIAARVATGAAPGRVRCGDSARALGHGFRPVRDADLPATWLR